MVKQGDNFNSSVSIPNSTTNESVDKAKNKVKPNTDSSQDPNRIEPQVGSYSQMISEALDGDTSEAIQVSQSSARNQNDKEIKWEEDKKETVTTNNFNKQEYPELMDEDEIQIIKSIRKNENSINKKSPAENVNFNNLQEISQEQFSKVTLSMKSTSDISSLVLNNSFNMLNNIINSEFWIRNPDIEKELNEEQISVSISKN